MEKTNVYVYTEITLQLNIKGLCAVKLCIQTCAVVLQKVTKCVPFKDILVLFGHRDN